MAGWEQIAIQVPIVAAFIWYVLEMDKRNASYSKERDEQWRSFLADERRAFTESLNAIASTVKALADRMESHDERTKEAIIEMETTVGLRVQRGKGAPKAKE
jgi:hypothetical protein